MKEYTERIAVEPTRRRAARKVGAGPTYVVGSTLSVAERHADTLADRIVDTLAGARSDAMTSAMLSAPSRIRRSTTTTTRAAAAVGAAGGPLDESTASRIRRRIGGGTPLDAGPRARFEPAIGVGLGRVHVHTGAEATELSDNVGAVAFTTGSDVFFRDGMPDTSTPDGQHLLAHELAHVVQQGGAEPIRRKVGLEFETGIPVRAPAFDKIPYQTDVLVAGTGHWKAVADSSNIEFVTEPFDEDTEGGRDLVAAVGEIVTWVELMMAHMKSVEADAPGPQAQGDLRRRRRPRLHHGVHGRRQAGGRADQGGVAAEHDAGDGGSGAAGHGRCSARPAARSGGGDQEHVAHPPRGPRRVRRTPRPSMSAWAA